MGLVPYGVLGHGRFQTEAASKEREKGHQGRNFIPRSEHDRNASKVLENVAMAKGCELLQVALAYIQQKSPYAFPLVGQRKVDHHKGRIGGLGVTLSEEEIAVVESAFVSTTDFLIRSLVQHYFIRRRCRRVLMARETLFRQNCNAM